MLYPKKINAKKGKIVIKIMLLISLIIAILLYTINKIVTPTSHWAALSIACIIYIWVTVLYALNKNVNVAAHVLVQTIAISALLVYIDYILGFEKWSLNIAIPIILMTSNMIMLLLTIISRKKYIRYVIFQLMLCLISFTPVILISERLVEDKTLGIIAVGISIANFIICLILCKTDIIEELKRKFHI